jgi:DNA repair protein SbcD/Mre11
MIANFRNGKARILKYSIRFANQSAGTASLYGDTESITDLKPMDVFEKRMERENLEEATRDLLRDAFRELLEEVEQQTKEE